MCSELEQEVLNMAQDILDHTCTRKELANFYREVAGIDSLQFDQESLAMGGKPHAVLHREIKNQDVIAFAHEKLPGNVTKYGSAVRGVGKTPNGKYLLETGRKIGDHPIRYEVKPWTWGGQHRRNESPIPAIKREGWGELRQRINESRLWPLTQFGSPEPTLRKSSVYPRTMAISMVHRFLYEFETELSIRRFVDGNTTIFLDEFNEIPLEATEKHQTSIAYFNQVFGTAEFLQRAP